MEQTLGKRIVANRKRIGLTQEQLAEQLGVTAQAVSKWENDQSCPDITILPQLADIFGISTDALCTFPERAFTWLSKRLRNTILTGLNFILDLILFFSS